MPVCYYRPLPALAASFLLLSGCTATRVTQQDATAAQLPQATQQASTDDGMDTEGTIWTLLGIAKKPPHDFGINTGPGVSAELWQATIDTLSFASMDSLDPQTGLAVTDWYSPKGRPDERLRVTAFIKARALRSDSIVVTVERQTRSGGQWQDAGVAQKLVDDLENAILQRAREVHIARLRVDQQ
ncbi:MAG TPA: DUF3576 domain-containing protein [Stellaceae bacterium]|nr:DUF3576 domain-containing protein [Stellaceae bacterium]